MAFASLDGQSISLQGDLKFPNIVNIRKQVEGFLGTLSGEVIVDFGSVNAVDSSALSFWLCCLRFSQENGTQLKALNMPKDMLGIIRLVGLDDKIN